MAASAVGAGLLVAASVPPWGFWPLAFPGTAVLAWRLGGLHRARSRAWAALLFSFGLFGPTLFWISEFHAVGYVALLLLEGSFFALAGALTPPGRARLSALAAVPAAFVLAEAARGVMPFGGLPMGGIALGQATGPLAPAARLGGNLLVAGLAASVGAGLLEATARRWRSAGALVAVPALVALLGLAAPDGAGPVDPARRPVRFTIVQGGGERGFRAVDTDPRSVLAAHLAVSENLRPPLDLVLWPENTIDVTAIDDSEEDAALGAVARAVHATVVAGVTEDVGDDNFQNLAVAWAPDGRIVDRYVKAHRVPFGEYVPLRRLLDPVVDLSVLPRDAVAGRGPGILRTPAGDFGVGISYEVFFGERGRAAARAGGEVLLVPTNAASFTSSQVPTQEVAAARLRAWETGRWVLVSAPTGYGAVVDADGRLLARTTLGRAELLRGVAERRTGTTVYVRFGDVPVLVLAVALLLTAWWPRRRGQPSTTDPASPAGGATSASEQPPSRAARSEAQPSNAERGNQTTRFVLAISPRKWALGFGVRCWVVRSTATMPNVGR